MNKNKIIGLVSAALLIASAWLPWAKVATISVNGFQGELGGNPGIFFIVTGILGALFIFLGKTWSNIVAILLALSAIGLSIKYLTDISSFGEMAKAGFGLYAMLVGGVGLLAAAVLGFRKKATA